MEEVRKGWRRGEFSAPDCTYDAADVDLFDIVVYLYLCRRADGEARSFPSYNLIARDCKLSRRKAVHTIASLMSKGLLTKEVRRGEKGGFTSNLYVIHHPEQRAPTMAADPDPGAPRAQPLRTTPSRPT